MTWIVLVACGFLGFCVRDESTSRAAAIVVIAVALMLEVPRHG